MLSGAAQLRDIDFLAVCCEHGSSDVDQLRGAIREANCEMGLIAKLNRASNFEDVEGIAKAADGVLITEVGLRSLAPSATPIAQKTVSRQCQVAAKPCLVERNAMRVMANGGGTDLAAIFDLANVAFDHVDCVVLSEVPVGHSETMSFLAAAAEILVVAESYLEITDRPVRVGFGQPPHTAALAYAIRHILKMQEIAAVTVYSLTGQTTRVISKNWIACPILAFSSRVRTARKMCLYHGVTSRHVEAPLNSASLLETAGMLAKDLQIAVPGDRIIVVSGHPNQTQDQANGFIVETIS
jgi:pyruvate kinase